MAGSIFTNLDNLCNVDCSNVHPLMCHLCHEQYQSPCLLDCYHIFCARCLRGRTNDNRLNCPLCGGVGHPLSFGCSDFGVKLLWSGSEWPEQLRGPAVPGANGFC